MYFCQSCGISVKENYGKGRFCSKICCASYASKSRIKNYLSVCKGCGKQLVRKKKPNKMSFCDASCQHKYQSQVFLEEWQSGKRPGLTKWGLTAVTIKSYFRRKQNNKCAWCGWGKQNKFSGVIPLEMHHIDGNWRNNLESNLVLICPNCHSLTDSYRNTGKTKSKLV